jgi:hypothetical protein
MSFLNKIKSSVHDPVFYTDVVEGRETGPFKYYLKLSLVLALVFSVTSSFMVVPRMKEFLVSAKSKIELNYPKELEVKIQGGVASTNAVEPYLVPVPLDLKVMDEDVKDFDNILVIDTKNDFTLERFNSYNTVILLTKDSFVVEGDNGRVNITPLKDIPNFTVNYENVTKVLARSESISRVLSGALPLLILVGVFIAYMFKLVYLLFVALLVMVIGKIKKLNLNFKKSYAVSMYAVTLPTLLSALFFFFGMPMPMLVPTVILLVVVWVNLKSSPVVVDTPAL